MKWRRTEAIPMLPTSEPKRWWVTEVDGKGRYKSFVLWENGDIVPLNEFNLLKFGWESVMAFLKARPGFEPVRNRKKGEVDDETQYAVLGL